MQFSIPGIENLSSAAKYVIAFGIIFVLLALFALILRRLTGGRLSLSSDRGRARQPRLGIVDVYDLDRQRQLILLRRDNVEHLLLVGGPNDVVVETNIIRVPGARLPVGNLPAEPAAEPVPERNVEIAPVRPVVEPAVGRIVERGPDPVVAQLGNAEPASNGAREPVGRATVEPPLKPSSIQATAGRLVPERPARPESGPAPARRPNGPAPSPSAAEEDDDVLSDMTKQLEEALKRPGQGQAEVRADAGERLPGPPGNGRGEPRPPQRPIELPRANPVARAPAPPPPPAQSRPEPAPTRAEPRTPAPPPSGRSEPEPAARPEPPRPEPQRAETSRPPSPTQEPGNPPAEAVIVPPRPQPQTAPPDRPAPSPERLGPAPERLGPPPTPPARRSAEPPAPPAPAAPAEAPAPPPTSPVGLPAAAGPAAGPGSAPAPSPGSAPPAAEPRPAPPAPEPKPAAGGKSDVFSIEDIEAEFARLLGRPIDRKDDGKA
ncbi:MAG: hypothetical protein JO048_13620 [Methylobacteriaceae bacterium]|nr:hypothetical protein [Methylobacteriaceae bacterium]